MHRARFTAKPARLTALFVRPSIVVALLALLASLAAPSRAAGSCTTSSPTSAAYTVTLCLTSPLDGTILTGDSAVTVTITFTGTSPGVQQLNYTLDGQYLLTAYAAPYSFTLPSARFVDGTHSLQLQAVMRDLFTTASTSVSPTFSNGVSSPPANSNTFAIRTGTTPAPGSPFVLAAAGDGASGEPSAGNVNGLIGNWNPNLFLYLGDVYEKGSISEFYNWYAPASFFGRWRSITDPTVGNHEYGTAGAAGYFDYWDNIPHYYSFDAAGWHVVSLDSTGQFGQTGTTSPQYQWLAQDLAAHAGQCIIAYFHQPVFNIGPEGPTTAMLPIWSLLAQNRVTLVLNGHDHDYQRWVALDGSGNPSPSGVTEFVVGTAGHGIQQFVASDTRVAFAFDTNQLAFGALRVELNASGASFGYINTQGTVLDAGVIPCVGSGADTNPPSTPGSVSATAESIPRIDVSWGEALDNVGVAGYTVYRNGQAVATVNGATWSYADTSVTVGASYSYQVDAFDSAGNHSALSSPVAVSAPNTFVLTPVADSYVNQDDPTRNYGASTALRTDASPVLNSYLRFDLQGWAPGANVLLRVYSNVNSGVGFRVQGVSDNSWNEVTINYGNAPSISPTIVGTSGPLSAGAWTTIDVGSLVTGNGLISLALTTTGTTTQSYASRETGATAPQLVIQTSPPSAPTPTRTKTQTPTPTRTNTPAPTPTSTPTGTPTPTSTALPTSTPFPAIVATPTQVIVPAPSTLFQVYLPLIFR